MGQEVGEDPSPVVADGCCEGCVDSIVFMINVLAGFD
jgi:hypothetical protein